MICSGASSGSLDGVHDRSTWEYETTVALRPVGTVGGVDSVVTANDTCVVTDPKLLDAVSWYTVVVAGRTVTELVPVTLPPPLSTVIEVAFAILHDNVPDCPAMIDAGLTVK